MKTRAALVSVLVAAALLAAAQRVAWAAPDNDDRVRTAPVSAVGTPRSLVSVAVPVPEHFAGSDSVSFTVVPTGAVELLGRIAGRLTRHPETGEWRPVLLTVRVPADAQVGALEVAGVTFRALGADSSDVPVVEVPIVLRVPATEGLLVEAPRPVSGLQPGDRVTIAFRVSNLGNAPERLVLRVQRPQGWQLRGADTLVVSIPPFGSDEVALSLRLPVGTAGGEYAVVLSGRRADADSAVFLPARATFQVADGRRESAGLVARPMLVSLLTSQGNGVAAGLRLDGPVAEGVRFSAHIMPRAPRTGLETMALASVGALNNAFQARLSTDTWSADAGLVGTSLTPLTGANALAQGVSARRRTPTYEAVGFAGRSGLRGIATGHHVGGGVWMPSAYGRIGGSIAVRREAFGGSFSRELTAIGADWSGTAGTPWSLDAGLALRSFQGGQHLGYRANGERDYGRGRLRLALTHAPGGSGAFANGTSNLEADVRHRLSERWTVDANAQQLRDRAASTVSTQARSLGFGSSHVLTEATSGSVRVTSTAFTGTVGAGGLGRFGASSHQLLASGSHRRGEWRFSGTGQVGIVGRDLELASGALSEVRVLQQALNVSASRAFSRLGVVTAGTGRTITGAGAGQPTWVSSTFLRSAGIPLAVGALPVRANAELQYVTAALQRPLLTARVGAATPLPGGFDLEASVERNPFFRDAQGNAGWLLALRVSASTEIFTPARRGASGVVFEDGNRNGRQDAGEPGVAGVRLVSGESRVGTDRDGRYRLPSGVRGRLRVDPASVPLGLVVPRAAADALGEQLDLPLVPTGIAELRLAILADEDGRRPEVDLTQARVWLVDADGAEWLGRLASAGGFRFENVPVGRYQVRFDGAALSEPLRIAEGEVVNVAARERRVHEVGLRGRAVRLIVPPSRGGTGTGGRGGPGGRGGNRGGSRGGAALAPGAAEGRR